MKCHIIKLSAVAMVANCLYSSGGLTYNDGEIKRKRRLEGAALCLRFNVLSYIQRYLKYLNNFVGAEMLTA